MAGYAAAASSDGCPSDFCQRQLQDSQAAGHGDSLVPISSYLAVRESLAVFLHQLSINLLPLCLKRSAEHGVADLYGGGRQRIERSLRTTGSGLNLRKVDGGDLSQLVWVPVTNATDEDADTAHGGSFGATMFSP
jgi:hypothetical protein